MQIERCVIIIFFIYKIIFIHKKSYKVLCFIDEGISIADIANYL